MRATYWNPGNDTVIETAVSAGGEWALIEAVLGHRSGRGHPAVEVMRPDGSSLALGTDGERAVLTWINPLGEPSRSVGEDDSTVLVYDYFGSWTEAPGSALVPLDDAVDCLQWFLRSGAPDTDKVLFTPE
jgi:hypothetical protein